MTAFKELKMLEFYSFSRIIKSENLVDVIVDEKKDGEEYRKILPLEVEIEPESREIKLNNGVLEIKSMLKNTNKSGGDRVRWDPYEEIRKMEKRMNKIFEEFWIGRQKLLGSGEGTVPYEKSEVFREPFADVIETEKEIIVTAELPGVEKNDIKINAAEESVEISAEAKREIKEEKKGYLRRERGYEKFYRFFTLSTPVDPNKTKATYKNGVLEVTLPKTKAAKKTPVRVD